MNPIILSILNLIRGQFGDVVSISNFDSTVILDKLIELQNSVGTLSNHDGPIAPAHVILLAAGVVIFLGVAGEAFFKKTGIPDVAFLMILGVIIGPVFGLIQPEAVISVVPYFAALALIIIMFDGGLNLDIKHVVKTVHFSITLAILGFILSVVIITLAAHFALGWLWLESILLGSIVGGSSSAIVFGLVRNIKISDDAKSMLSFESAVTDILATIIAFILFEAVLSGHFDLQTLEETLGRAIVVGLVLGFGVGIPWMYVSTKLGNAQHAYMLTLGVLFVLFFLANSFGESGALTALVFGLMIGNKRHLSKILKFKLPKIEMDDPTHNQLTFLVRSFFFVFVGLMASFGQIEYMVFGILATIAIYFGRSFIGKITLTKRFSKLDKAVTNSMIPRGLAAAVLATYPITLGLPNAEAYSQMVFFIILSSVIITTIGLGKSKKIPPPESVEGGFVKPTDDSDEGSVKEVQTETSNNFQKESIEGGFVKPTDDSQRE
ncbi:transporter, CPA2 family [Candidatus Nitrosopumilus salaria BD31]|uniref:Transporter, CPA2 family n=1 Tax=Candidatus Nitrosopumilus salarius BD31 TaxID=859350 RepID=I3D561_9ARCH|nr:cation:proton antiporter [Candidatus Nitrosopumilus salaria]EIJ66854.1 transporter, CPA2 family [Candidatus Nitrosopumilus salaria BD31]